MSCFPFFFFISGPIRPISTRPDGCVFLCQLHSTRHVQNPQQHTLIAHPLDQNTIMWFFELKVKFLSFLMSAIVFSSLFLSSSIFFPSSPSGGSQSVELQYRAQAGDEVEDMYQLLAEVKVCFVLCWCRWECECNARWACFVPVSMFTFLRRQQHIRLCPGICCELQSLCCV